MPTRSRAQLRLGLAGAVALAFALAVPVVLAADRDVAIRDFAFAPGTVQIRVGDSVTWTNRDSVAHSATARNGSFDTGLLEEGESRSVRFTVAGTYRYLCTPHPNMTATVVVRAAGTGVQPPNTDTAVAAEPPADGSPSAVTALGALGAAAFIFLWRSVRRRRMMD
jgi:plastocyanin